MLFEFFGMIEIATFINFPINSNCYVVYSQQLKRCVIIDPGSEDSSEIISFIETNGLILDYIILTHEHFDHIWSADTLRYKYNSKLISSRHTSKCLINPKLNLSVFYNQIGFSIEPADILIEEISFNLMWMGAKIEFLSTPGHSKGSICFIIENKLFTGDTMIKGIKTVTKLPGSNILHLQNSLSLIFNQFNLKTEVFPGHNKKFFLESYNLLNV